MTRARPDLAQPPAVAKIAAVIYGRDVRRLLAGRLTPDTEARIYDLARRGARHVARVLDAGSSQDVAVDGPRGDRGPRR